MGISTFEDLEVWQRSHRLTLTVYRLTRSFPEDEKFGVTAQMRRAAVSIPANIAEGFGRRQAKDKCRFYNIAEGSAEELKYLLRLARDLEYLRDVREYRRQLDGISSMLRRLIDVISRGNGGRR